MVDDDGICGAQDGSTRSKPRMMLENSDSRGDTGEPIVASMLGDGRTVHLVDVGVVTRTLAALLREDGWVVRSEGASLGRDLTVVGEGHGDPVDSARTLLICGASPLKCRAALDRLLELHFGVLVPEDLVLDVSGALDALDRGVFQLRCEVFARAARVPMLEARQRRVLEKRLAGHSSADVAQQLNVSIATVKRDIADLRALFGVRTTHELISKALLTGYRPNGNSD